MRDDLITLRMTLDKVGLQLNLSEFDSRLKLQKAIYLIQLSGVDLGYRYSWYLRGPYCTELTKDLFELESDKSYDSVSKKYEFSDDIEPLIKKGRVLLKKPSSVKLSDAYWFELLASLHYLKHIAYISNIKNKTFENIYDALGEDKKKRFSPNDAKKAWRYLDKNDLIKFKEMPNN